MNINDLREKVQNGDFDDNELIDLVLYLERENQVLLEENQKYKEVIDKAIKFIEDTYYSKNTTDIDSIVSSSDKLIKVREILKEVK
ncbi:MAG: hypothetical protein MR598_03220 [Erysipelotrichaceae bacterium]|nr:hypothetical protein [Erysipelotrichaceae bacterium]